MSELNDLKILSALFVEDDSYARRAMESILRNLFGQIVLADNGRNGLDIFGKTSVDIVITDLWMPEMTGFEMIAGMKAHNPELVVVVMSAYDVPDYEKRAENLGIFGFLKKPFTLADFEAVLKEAGHKAAEIKRLNS
ncbi:response regulator [Geovibrio thiophilus]|uniref:Response regulator n=1 Tax=Geovibrio thiophilus TaxID=139438 RepID=A0A3R5YYB3_9BACT|nr:response regulator [Geovibrio thiophilus]QAR32422.1 response regulator [Geovibrio thiophilus]